MAGIRRREFLRAVGAIALAVPVASAIGVTAAAGTEDKGEDKYFEEFIVENDSERLEYYGSIGFIAESERGRCVANPLQPDRCITYTKPYEEQRFPLLPPGASKAFYEKCVRCGLCFFACARMGYHSIRLRGFESGLEKLGTPVVDDVMNRPCTLCMECTKVCPTGALEEVSKDRVKMGIALIDPDLCWAWNSGDCKSCAKACPFGSEVFEFTYNEWGVHTRVRPDKCRGCGLCVPACPVIGSAIHVLPIEVYRERVKNYKNTGMSYDEYLKLILETEVKDPFKATWRAAINADYIMNRRGLIKEKIKV